MTSEEIYRRKNMTLEWRKSFSQEWRRLQRIFEKESAYDVYGEEQTNRKNNEI